ncbi:MAG: glycosyltransferase family 2 protein [Gammaproteobacteria bacterium]
MILEIISLIPTILILGGGIWALEKTLKTPKLRKGLNFSKKKIVLVFPCYKDVVAVDKWLSWSKDISKIIIVEDITNGNNSDNPLIEVIKRNNRNGFKAGACNDAINYIIKKNIKCDYVFFFDADHIPSELSYSSILPHLYSEVIQFFWNDGMPYTTAIDNLTFSARYYSNINNYNRAFQNLTGSAMAISMDIFKQGIRFPESITEDYALTLKLLAKGINVTVCPLIISVGQAPKTFKAFIRQQDRWAEGTVRDARIMGSKLKMSFMERFDWFMQVNVYLQGLWFTLSLIFFLSGLLVGWLAVLIIAIELICFYSQLRKAPVKYWIHYFFLNYIVMIPQIKSVIKGITENKGFFDRTYKKGLSYE